MKVKIGKYRNRLISRIHDRHMVKKYGYIDIYWTPKSLTKFEKFLEWLEYQLQGFYNIINWLWFDRQTRTIKVKIDRWDTYSMDCTLGYIIRPMLKQLKENMKDHFFEIDLKDIPTELISENSESIKIEHWQWVLSEMIFAFDSLEGGPNENRESEYSIRRDWDGLDEYQKRVQRGFFLFGKYYTHLWT